MKRVKLKDGSLEVMVQRELRASGLKFRRHIRILPGRPDIVFPEQKVAVFVDGDPGRCVQKASLSEQEAKKVSADHVRQRRNVIPAWGGAPGITPPGGCRAESPILECLRFCGQGL